MVGPDIGDAGNAAAQGHYGKAALQTGEVLGSMFAPEAAAATYNASLPFARDTAKALIERMIKPQEKDLFFGHDPAEGILTQEGGATARSLQALKARIERNAARTGSRIRPAVAAAPQTPVDIEEDLIGPVRTATQAAARRNEPGLVGRLHEFRRSLTNRLGTTPEGNEIIDLGPRDLRAQTPADLLDRRHDIRDRTRWTNQNYDDEVNAVQRDAYAAVTGRLHDMVPGLADLDRSYGNLRSAQDAITRRIPIAGRNNFMSLSDTLTGTAGVAANHPGVGAALVAGKKLLNLTPAKTFAADQLWGLGQLPEVAPFDLSPGADAMNAINRGYGLSPRPFPTSLGAWAPRRIAGRMLVPTMGNMVSRNGGAR